MNETGHRIVVVGMVINFHMTFPSTPTVLMEFPRTMAFRGLVIIPTVRCKYWWTLHDAGLPPRAYRWLASPRQFQGDQVNLVMGGLEDERIKIAIETSNINTPEVLAAHFRVLDEQRLGRSKPETSNVSPTVSPAKSKSKTYTNSQRATALIVSYYYLLWVGIESFLLARCCLT
ncbi:hypothetical protein MTP99_017293 [Tenebrio molitor]|nr:hypothetical protein MTP99_017293 [Tenebrio molitor]